MANITVERALPTPYSNSPLLPFLLLTLLNQKFFPETKSCIKNEYDYIIVGAGSAGSVLANRLSENPYARVLVLEAGGPPAILSEVPALCTYLIDIYYNWKLKSVPQKNAARQMKNRVVDMWMGKALGGSSTLNAMLDVRGNRKNYDGWNASGATGWSYDDVLPYFKKLESMQAPQYLNKEFHGFSGPVAANKPPYHPLLKKLIEKFAKDSGYKIIDSNGAHQFGFFDLTATTKDGRRCSTAKAYLVPAAHRTNLDIVSNAFVTRVIIENNRAVGVEVEFNGQTHRVHAKEEVILSAGAIHTPQILMLSGVGPRNHLSQFQIPVVGDLPVGLNYHDHISAITLFRVSEKIASFESKLQNSDNILQYIQNGTGVLASAASAVYHAFLSGPKETTGTDPTFQLTFLENSSGFLTKKDKGKALYTCIACCLQPQSRGSISLNSSNPHDPPLINPNYYDKPQDLRVTVEGMKMCRKMLESETFKLVGATNVPIFDEGCQQYEKLNEDMYLQCLAQNFGISYSHHSGTAKMGCESDPTTVLNSQLKVKGIQNLRVVDASVMPQVTSGNTNVPVIMIAEKAADLIKKDWFEKYGYIKE